MNQGGKSFLPREGQWFTALAAHCDHLGSFKTYFWLSPLPHGDIMIYLVWSTAWASGIFKNSSSDD